MLLLGFGKDLKVLSPNRLVADIQSAANGILSLYA
jgi:predicted DNA-binding transcriptional regulator YafY